MKTTVTLVQRVTDVYYACPHCGRVVCEKLEDFERHQTLDFQNFPDWEYEDITCEACGQKIEPIYEFD